MKICDYKAFIEAGVESDTVFQEQKSVKIPSKVAQAFVGSSWESMIERAWRIYSYGGQTASSEIYVGKTRLG